MVEGIISVYIGILGLVFGSFALAMVDRMHAKKDWVRSRSACESCKKTLGIRDLFPVLSWLVYRGKCRRCHVRLSAVYPLVELATGLAFVGSYIFWPQELTTTAAIIQFGVWLAAVVILIALVIFDMRWFLLPNKLIYPLIGLSIVFAALGVSGKGLSTQTLVSYGVALVVGFGIFLLLHIISKGRWIGDGDVRLGVAIAFFTGSGAVAWLTIFLASFVGLAFSIPVLLRTKNKANRMKLKLPFGPSLIVGLYIAVLFGQHIVDWYTSNILHL